MRNVTARKEKNEVTQMPTPCLASTFRRKKGPFPGTNSTPIQPPCSEDIWQG